MPLSIRAARSGDADRIACLIAQLGYPNTSEAIRQRMRPLCESNHDGLLVAELADSVVGLAGIHMVPMLHRAGHVARVTALVVDERARRQGIGAKLLAACEQAALQRGCERVEITSGLHRHAAHEFYSTQGYQITAHRFAKDLSPLQPE
jgi:N-acetylglutamate synthase-like GNAT family acetyltransferase